MNIVPYQTEEHEQLVEIWLRAVCATHSFLSEEDIRFYHQKVREEALQSVEVWMALDSGGAPVGFIGMNGPKVEMLFVEPDVHGQGIGRALLHHAVALKGRTLLVDVNEQNPGACAFYSRFGFVQQGRSELDSAGRAFPLLHLAYTGEMKVQEKPMTPR